MPKPKKSSTKKAPILSRRKRTVIGVTIIALVLLQLSFDAAIAFRHFTSLPQSEPTVATVIFDAIEGMYSPVPVDAQTGKRYIADARLVLPASAISDMQYQYMPADGTSPMMVTFTTGQMIHYGESQTVGAYYDTYMAGAFTFNREGKAFEALFNNLPSLQACARGVQVFEAAQTDNDSLKQQATKQLHDGRTLYFYTEDQCTQQTQLNELLEVVKAIESY